MKKGERKRVDELKEVGPAKGQQPRLLRTNKHSIEYSYRIRLRQTIHPLYHYLSIIIASNLTSFRNLGLLVLTMTTSSRVDIHSIFLALLSGQLPIMQDRELSYVFIDKGLPSW